jgi:hypothetical protein
MAAKLALPWTPTREGFHAPLHTTLFGSKLSFCQEILHLDKLGSIAHLVLLRSQEVFSFFCALKRFLRHFWHLKSIVSPSFTFAWGRA